MKPEIQRVPLHMAGEIAGMPGKREIIGSVPTKRGFVAVEAWRSEKFNVARTYFEIILDGRAYMREYTRFYTVPWIKRLARQFAREVAEMSRGGGK